VTVLYPSFSVAHPLIAATAGGIVNIGQVTEVDLSQSIIWSPKNRLVGQVIEIDLAFRLVTEGGGWVLRRRRRHGN